MFIHRGLIFNPEMRILFARVDATTGKKEPFRMMNNDVNSPLFPLDNILLGKEAASGKTKRIPRQPSHYPTRKLIDHVHLKASASARLITRKGGHG